MRFALLLVFVIFLWSCGDTETSECVSSPPDAPQVTLTFEHLEDTLLNIRTKDDLVAFFKKEPLIRDYIFRRQEYPNDSLFIQELYNRFANPAIDTLGMETRRIFGDLSDLRSQFTQAFSNIKAYYPDFTPPVVKTVISGLDTDLLISDSVIIVSLDFFLGPTGKYRPKYYDYLLRRYQADAIVPSCVTYFGMSNRFNKTNLQDKTVLADMVGYGKSFYFAKHMMPCTPDSLFMWYSADEMKGSRANESMIWARLIQDKVIFSTSMIDKRNYLGERPFTLQVGEKCPGRIAQWIGWRIVDKYMDSNPDTSLPELMQMSDAQTLFRESKYRPQDR